MKAAAVWLEAAGEFVQRPAVQGGVLFFVPVAAFHCAVHCTLFVSTSLLVLSCLFSRWRGVHYTQHAWRSSARWRVNSMRM